MTILEDNVKATSSASNTTGHCFNHVGNYDDEIGNDKDKDNDENYDDNINNDNSNENYDNRCNNATNDNHNDNSNHNKMVIIKY